MCWWMPVIQPRPEISGRIAGMLADGGHAEDAPGEGRADERDGGQGLAFGHLAAGVQHRHAGRERGAGRRAVDLAGADRHRRPGAEAVGRRVRAAPAKRQKEMWRQSGFSGWWKPRASVAASADAHAEAGDVVGLVGREGEAERRGIDEDEAVAAVGGVDGQRAEALDLERHAEAGGEARQVAARRCARPCRPGTRRGPGRGRPALRASAPSPAPASARGRRRAARWRRRSSWSPTSAGCPRAP